MDRLTRLDNRRIGLCWVMNRTSRTSATEREKRKSKEVKHQSPPWHNNNPHHTTQNPNKTQIYKHVKNIRRRQNVFYLFFWRWNIKRIDRINKWMTSIFPEVRYRNLKKCERRKGERRIFIEYIQCMNSLVCMYIRDMYIHFSLSHSLLVEMYVVQEKRASSKTDSCLPTYPNPRSTLPPRNR